MMVDIILILCVAMDIVIWGITRAPIVTMGQAEQAYRDTVARMGGDPWAAQ